MRHHARYSLSTSVTCASNQREEYNIVVEEGSTLQPSRISASQPTRIIGFEEFIEAASK
jgi:hypothetical protein